MKSKICPEREGINWNFKYELKGTNAEMTASGGRRGREGRRGGGEEESNDFIKKMCLARYRLVDMV